MSHSKHLHFIGICGTAMGSTAVALRALGYAVSGSDQKVYPPMSDVLREAGITLTEGYKAENLPKNADLYIVGNAISRGNEELETLLERKLPYVSMAELLKREVIQGKRSFVVSGTHGKTTTTTMLAWIFEHAGRDPGFMIGGVPENFTSGARFTHSDLFVIEGDEYDTAFFDKRSKFLHYLPELVIVNNIEFDHADIYRDLDEIKTSFRRLLNIVPGEGMVLVNADDPASVDVARTCPAPIVEVGFSPNAGHHILEPEQGKNGSSFGLFGTRFEVPLLGQFNIRNAAMAASAAHFYGVPVDVIGSALASFAGIKRRQEVRGVVKGITVIDDFGHHPTAIRETLSALRSRYSPGKIWAVFEPRSNTTRRNIFQHDLPKAFANADGVFLGAVARLDQIPPEERLDPEQVIADIAATGKPARYESSADAIVASVALHASEGDVVVVFSNGSFDGIHAKLLSGL